MVVCQGLFHKYFLDFRACAANVETAYGVCHAAALQVVVLGGSVGAGLSPDAFDAGERTVAVDEEVHVVELVGQRGVILVEGGELIVTVLMVGYGLVDCDGVGAGGTTFKIAK